MKEEIIYKGKKAKDCSKEELLFIIDEFMNVRSAMNDFRETSEIKRLKHELEIKDEIINRFIKK